MVHLARRLIQETLYHIEQIYEVGDVLHLLLGREPFQLHMGELGALSQY